MPVTRTVALLILSIIAVAPVDAQRADEQVLHWTVMLPDTLPIGDSHRTYAVDRSVLLAFVVNNKSSIPIRIDEARLRARLTLRVFNSDGAEIPTVLEWLPQVRISTEDAARNTDLMSATRVEPATSAGWFLSIERTDGQLFVAGEYSIVPTTRGFPAVVTTASGDAWRGRARDGSAGIVLVVTPPRNARETSLFHIQAALQATRQGDLAKEVQAYEEALAADPTTENLSSVANAYSRAGRYRDSIAALEQVLRRVSANPTRVREVSRDLAVLHVMLGDEVSADRALRSGGVPEDRIPAVLDDIRKATAQARGQ